MGTGNAMRAAAVTLAGLGVTVSVAGAQVSGSKPLLCTVIQVMDCRNEDTCERESPGAINLPRFLRLDLTQKSVGTVDQAQRAPVHYVERVDGHLIVQGGQHTRAWSLVIGETSGLLSGAITEPDGTFALSGACLNP
jgi:hypothetical protein